MALMIARQRAAHQALDHSAILDDPFAMTILGEDDSDVVRFATAHPLASIGRLFTAARSRIAEEALSRVDHPALRKSGEHSVSRFEPAGMAAILRSHGFGAIEDIGFQAIASRFGHAVQGLAPGHAGVRVVHAKH
jgi:hypothetical protein